MVEAHDYNSDNSDHDEDKSDGSLEVEQEEGVSNIQVCKNADGKTTVVMQDLNFDEKIEFQYIDWCCHGAHAEKQPHPKNDYVGVVIYRPGDKDHLKVGNGKVCVNGKPIKAGTAYLVDIRDLECSKEEKENGCYHKALSRTLFNMDFDELRFLHKVVLAGFSIIKDIMHVNGGAFNQIEGEKSDNWHDDDDAMGETESKIIVGTFA